MDSEIIKLRVEMVARKMKAGELAGKAGLRPKVVYNMLAGYQRSWPPKEAVNRVLGVDIFTRPPAGRPGRRRGPARQEVEILSPIKQPNERTNNEK